MHIQKNIRIPILIVLLIFSIFNFFHPVILLEIPRATNNATPFKLETLIENAEAGDPESQYQLALRYQNGRGVEKDNQKAFSLYKNAANQGHAKAQNNLGVCYQTGDSVEVDLEKALALYKSAAESGLSIAQENLADIYLIKKDYTNALLLFSKLAETNSAKAYKTLGYLYLEGLGVTPDHNKAKEFFEKAATQNDAYSQYHLGEIYRKEANYERAHYWINKAVEHNYAQAYGSLGFMYVKGRGVEKNPLTTGKLYKKLADTNDNAMIKHLEEIEQYCVQPYAPTADHVEACLVSAGAGSADARKLLAVYYFHGQGVEKDPIESLAWGLLTPMHVPTEKKDPIAARAFGVSAHLLLTLDAESIAKAKAKSIDYRNQYATPPADLSNLTSKD